MKEELEKKADKYHLDNVTSEEVFYHAGMSEKVRKAFVDGAKSRDKEVEQERNYAFEYLKPLIDGQKKEIEKLSKMLELAINEVVVCGKQMKAEHPSMIVWTEQTFREELEKRVEK